MMHQREWPGITSRLAAGWCVARRSLCAAIALLLATTPARAHEVPERVAIRGVVQREGRTLHLLLRVPLEAMRDVDFPLRADGSLDLVRARTLLPGAAQTWLVTAIDITADGTTLGAPRITGTRLALPSDRSFDDPRSARAAFARAPIDSQRIQWQQVLLDVALEYTLPSPGARLVLHPALASLGIRTTSLLQVVMADGRTRTLVYDGNPGAVPLDPAWYQTGVRFARAGFLHILAGYDHLLFVCCLVLGLRGLRSLVTTITAFTVAHSITLAATALGVVPGRLWFPPLVEALIAASIIWVAIENIVLTDERLASRWAIAFTFGLVHGFGFSFALSDSLQFAGGNLVSALLAFNLGVEAGQVTALAVAVPLLWLLRRHAGRTRERVLTIVLSVIVAHTAWHWMTARAAELGRFRGSIGWPAADAATALVAMRLSLLAAVALAVALSMRQILRVSRRS
ncbi:MAG: HupE/UreJ family protein [Gemmatimonadaceae bacterium]|nr:HupE/UreJ family protein [Gemmatimonadaceae bacterium]